MEDIKIDIDDCDLIADLSGEVLNGMVGYIRKAKLSISPHNEGVLIYLPHLFPDEFIKSLVNKDNVSE